MTGLFGVLLLERDPFTFANLPGLLQQWFIGAGGFALVGIGIYILYALLTPTDKSGEAKERAGIPAAMLFSGIASMFLFLAAGVMAYRGFGIDPELTTKQVEAGYTYRYVAPVFSTYPVTIALSLAGLLACFGISYPFLKALFKVRLGRVYAVAKLCYLEMLRNKIFYLFLAAMLLTLLPVSKWLNNLIMAEDELRSALAMPTFIIVLLSLSLAVLTSSFSIPNDVNRQTIYTLVTKPMERLELLLGRFLGYLFVVTLGMLGMTLFSVIVIATTKIDEKAKEETYLSRVPLRGDMEFRSRKAGFDGTLVGREHEYRKYISGDPTSPQRAIWKFNQVPSNLMSQTDGVKTEFNFDIFKLTKGEENKGVFCQIVFASADCEQVPPEKQGDGFWKWKDSVKEEQYRKEAVELLTKATGRQENTDSIRGVLGGAKPDASDELGKKIWAVAEQLSEKYGYFEIPSVEVFDFHPVTVKCPASFFKNASNTKPQDGIKFRIFVKCESRSQLLGMAKGDLYVMETINSFEANFIRSMFGLWCKLAILIAVSLCLSTFFSGVVSMIISIVIYIMGLCHDHMDEVARGVNVGGGPLQSFTNIMKAEQPTAMAPESKLLLGTDNIFQWILGKVRNVFPDLDAFDWTNFVREGFNVNYEYMAMNFIVMLGYILPWFVLGYYLLRSREVADS